MPVQVPVQKVEEAAVFVFFCYYQHYYLRGLPVFLTETWALTLVVLHWRRSMMVVLSRVESSAGGSHVEVVAWKELF